MIHNNIGAGLLGPRRLSALGTIADMMADMIYHIADMRACNKGLVIMLLWCTQEATSLDGYWSKAKCLQM